MLCLLAASCVSENGSVFIFFSTAMLLHVSANLFIFCFTVFVKAEAMGGPVFQRLSKGQPYADIKWKDKEGTKSWSEEYQEKGQRCRVLGPSNFLPTGRVQSPEKLGWVLGGHTRSSIPGEPSPGPHAVIWKQQEVADWQMPIQESPHSWLTVVGFDQPEFLAIEYRIGFDWSPVIQSNALVTRDDLKVLVCSPSLCVGALGLVKLSESSWLHADPPTTYFRNLRVLRHVRQCQAVVVLGVWINSFKFVVIKEELSSYAIC